MHKMHTSKDIIYTLVNISLHACQPVCIYRMYITGHGIHTEHWEQCLWNVQRLAANWAAGIFRHVTRLMHICREVYIYTIYMPLSCAFHPKRQRGYLRTAKSCPVPKWSFRLLSSPISALRVDSKVRTREEPCRWRRHLLETYIRSMLSLGNWSTRSRKTA